MTKSLKVDVPPVTDIFTLLVWNPRERKARSKGLVPIAIVPSIDHQPKAIRVLHHFFPGINVNDLLRVLADLPIPDVRHESLRVPPKMC